MLNSFRYAIEGIVHIFKYHRHFRTHIGIGLLIVLISYLLQIDRIEFLVIILLIFMVITAEMINTTIEEITNLITVKWDKHAKIAKDVAAGMVLISSLGAAIIGFYIFIPYVIRFFL